MAEIDPDFPFEFLEEEQDNVRAPDAVVREQLIPTAHEPTPNGAAGHINHTSNSHSYASLPANIYNMSVEEQIAYIEQLSCPVRVDNSDFEIRKRMQEVEEENTRKREEMTRKTDEYWKNLSEQYQIVISLSKRLRIDPSIKDSCIFVEDKMNMSITRRIKFIRMNEEEYDLFYKFIHFIYPTESSSRKRISDEVYELISNHFILDE